MDFELCIRRLERDAAVITGLVNGIPDEQARWKPSADAWSMLEVINHLHDEEREDFRTRLDLILHQPGAAWPPTDPEGWVAERRYNARDPQESLEDFLQERTRPFAGCKAWKPPAGRYGDATRPALRCQQATCWPHGWRTTCFTFASWRNCTANGSSPLARPTYAMPATGNAGTPRLWP